ncbi:hypothetical protein [Micromonospora sp. NPDC005413]
MTAPYPFDTAVKADSNLDREAGLALGFQPASTQAVRLTMPATR